MILIMGRLVRWFQNDGIRKNPIRCTVCLSVTQLIFNFHSKPTSCMYSDCACRFDVYVYPVYAHSV